jgi:predicted nucleotidyltransferase
VTNGRQHPAVVRLAHIAMELGELREQVVFIGGAIAPLLQVAPPFAAARPTSDVDGITASTSYGNAYEIEQALRAKGFRQTLGDTHHAHRWLAPSGIPLDLVPAGQHLGASGSRWDAIAVETSVEIELSPGLVIRHANAPAFLALKWSAYHDRGRHDPPASHDLEDIIALVASRPNVPAEVAASHCDVRAFLREQAAQLIGDPSFADILAAHLNNARHPAAAIRAAHTLLHEIAGR